MPKARTARQSSASISRQTEVRKLLSDKRNKSDGDDDHSYYYENMPFRSYDEIMARRRRAALRRRGCLFGFLIILIITMSVVTIGLFSGGFIFRRMVNGTTPSDASQSRNDQTVTGRGDTDKNGFTLDTRQPSGDESQLITTYDVSGVVEHARQSVVGIVSESYSSFSTSDSGSGIIMSDDGYIVTNNHVISGGDSITVVLYDGTNYPAYLIGSDPYSDIAVLKIPCTDLTPADFGDSDTLTAGEPAIAIGNPGGIQLQGTVTAGIISATNREITIDSNTMELIQTDASINPGNSGGPLLNRYGQVIGVTSAKISASGYEGIGFALPINTVKPIVEELVSDGYVSGRPLVGVSVRTVSQLAATFYGLPRGLMVDVIAEDSGAAKAGLQAGDIITHLCGSPVRSVSDACTIRNQYKAGDTVTLTYYRNGAVHDIEFVLDEQQDQTGYDF